MCVCVEDVYSGCVCIDAAQCCEGPLLPRAVAAVFTLFFCRFSTVVIVSYLLLGAAPDMLFSFFLRFNILINFDIFNF